MSTSILWPASQQNQMADLNALHRLQQSGVVHVNCMDFLVDGDRRYLPSAPGSFGLKQRNNQAHCEDFAKLNCEVSIQGYYEYSYKSKHLEIKRGQNRFDYRNKTT
jgi:hypothetical protein